MRKIKNLFTILLASFMALLLTACSSSVFDSVYKLPASSQLEMPGDVYMYLDETDKKIYIALKDPKSGILYQAPLSPLTVKEITESKLTLAANDFFNEDVTYNQNDGKLVLNIKIKSEQQALNLTLDPVETPTAEDIKKAIKLPASML